SSRSRAGGIRPAPLRFGLGVLTPPRDLVVRPGIWVVEAPGARVPGVLAPGALLPGTPLPGSAVPGVVAVGVGVGVGVGVVEAGAVVTVVVVAGGGPPDPASDMSAAASTPSDSATTTASATIGPLQPGAAARRVRAAAPQRRHHSCSACRGPPHSGQASPVGGGAGVDAGAGRPPAAEGAGGVATVTFPRTADGGSRSVPPRRRCPARAGTPRGRRAEWGSGPSPTGLVAGVAGQARERARARHRRRLAPGPRAQRTQGAPLRRCSGLSPRPEP